MLSIKEGIVAKIKEFSTGDPEIISIFVDIINNETVHLEVMVSPTKYINKTDIPLATPGFVDRLKVFSKNLHSNEKEKKS